MAIESNESQVALTLISKQRASHHKRNYDDKLCLFRSPSDNCVIIIDDDEDEETLESRKKKKPRLGSWWNYDEAINELSIVIKGLTKPKHDNEIASKVDLCCSSNDYDKRSSSTSTVTVTHQDLCVDHENVGFENHYTTKGYRHVTLEELGVSVEDLKSKPWEAFVPTSEIRSPTMDQFMSPYQLLSFPPLFCQFS